MHFPKELRYDSIPGHGYVVGTSQDCCERGHWPIACFICFLDFDAFGWKCDLCDETGALNLGRAGGKKLRKEDKTQDVLILTYNPVDPC
jgi:hypothetical protein